MFGRKKAENPAFGVFIQEHAKSVIKEEATHSLKQWYQLRLEDLPDMVVKRIDMPQYGWKREMRLKKVQAKTLPEDIRSQIADQEGTSLISYTEGSTKIQHTLLVTRTRFRRKKTVMEIESTGETGAAFDVSGALVTKYQLDKNSKRVTQDGKKVVLQRWWQPLIDQKTEAVDVWTKKGVRKIEVSGVVGMIKDTKGRVAIALEQEPGAHTEKFGLVRTPLQTSLAKLRAVRAGMITADPLMNVLQSVLKEGETLMDLFLQPGIVTPLAYADANRLNSKNIQLNLPPMPDDVIKKLTADGKIYMATLNDLITLHNARLLNFHSSGFLTDLLTQERQQMISKGDRR